ncbi:MAG TPA: hypothetical protein VFK31_05390 [Rhodanobacteraceae bacterium]|nr:hypothetical protein [Rhodanobacteraceae bacterium]
MTNIHPQGSYMNAACHHGNRIMQGSPDRANVLATSHAHLLKVMLIAVGA